MSKLVSMLVLLNSVIAFAAGKPFTIGAIYPVPDGKDAISAGAEAICMTEAVMKDAQDNKIPVRLEIFDNHRSPIGTQAAAERAIEASVDMTIGTFSSSEAVAAISVLGPAGVPHLSPTASSPKATAGHNGAFTLASADDHYSGLLAEFALKTFAPKSVYVIRNLSQESSLSGAKTFTERLKNGSPGVTIVERDIITGYSKYPELAAEIVSTKPSLIFVPLSSFEAGSLYVALKKAGTEVTLLGTDSVGGRADFFELIGDTSPSIEFLFFKQWSGTPEGPKTSHFEALRARYCSKMPLSMVLAAAYDTATLAVDAGRSGLPPADYIRRSDYHGVSGRHRFNADRFTSRPIHIYEIKDGQSRLKTTYGAP